MDGCGLSKTTYKSWTVDEKDKVDYILVLEREV